MIDVQNYVQGHFTYTGADGASNDVAIDFNPASLDYTITINAQGEGGQAQQAAGVASAKLNLELIFDTTDSGDDVRTKTNKVEKMLRPQAAAAGSTNGPQQAPPMVTFEWGAFKFIGIVDSFKQTMDFFAPNGIPLRAAVTLSMSQPNYQFDQQGATKDGKPMKSNVDQALVLPDGDPSQLAADAGDPTAARDIASANGLESLRGSAGGAVAIGGGVSIGAAASFSAGASASANASLGLDLGASAGAGAGAGFGFEASASAGVSFGASAGAGASFGASATAAAGFSTSFGAGASAGVSATGGAFSGLHTGSSATTGKYLAPQKLLATTSAPGVAPGALFDVTGRAVAQSSSTFKAEVGTTRGLRFDES